MWRPSHLNGAERVGSESIQGLFSLLHAYSCSCCCISNSHTIAQSLHCIFHLCHKFFPLGHLLIAARHALLKLDRRHSSIRLSAATKSIQNFLNLKLKSGCPTCFRTCSLRRVLSSFPSLGGLKTSTSPCEPEALHVKLTARPRPLSVQEGRVTRKLSVVMLLTLPMRLSNLWKSILAEAEGLFDSGHACVLTGTPQWSSRFVQPGVGSRRFISAAVTVVCTLARNLYYLTQLYTRYAATRGESLELDNAKLAVGVRPVRAS